VDAHAPRRGVLVSPPGHRGLSPRRAAPAHRSTLNDDDEFLGARELALFCSSQYIVSIHHEPLRTINALKERCCRDPENTLGRGMDHLLHALVDGVIDAYKPVLDNLENEAQELEDTALTDPRADALMRISEVKSQVLQIRRYLMPLRESIAQLARGEYGFIGRKTQPYFRDVLDHLTRTTELLDLYRDQVVGARDIYMSSLSQRTNETMKTLSIFATIMLPLTLISGIYGMNFDVLWPPQNHPYGFWMVIGAMVAVGGGLYLWFRRAHWL
jgi:magnesium transporter